MTANAAQASPTQNVAASRPSSGRRSLPTAVLLPIERPVSQRWRERPRCPALRVAPGPWRRGRSRHRWPCRVSPSARCDCPGRIRRPRAPVASPNHRGRPRHMSAHVAGRILARFDRTDHDVATLQSCPHAIARSSLVPCSASSMLFAALRPGTGAGPAGIDDACARHDLGFCAMAGFLMARAGGEDRRRRRG